MKARAALLLAIATLGSQATQAQGMVNEALISSDAFLSHHPDLRWRHKGLASYKAGRFAEAMVYFRRAARYGDKPSQAMISEMYRKGEGAAADPALAYVWIDLAAERGYTFLLVQREKLWEQLDPAQKQTAAALGGDVYNEYGDDAAKPRLESILRRTANKVTGSHAGFVGNIAIFASSGGSMGYLASGEQFYDKRFWQPSKYWEWQDSVWQSAGEGEVRIGPLEPIRPNDPTP